MIMKAAQKFGKLQFEVTKLAAEFIDLDEANFEASMKEAVKDEEIVKQMKADDEGVRMRCEKPRPNSLTRDQAKKIVIQKIKMEFETEKKLASLQIASQQQAQMIVMVERTRVMDKIFIEHKVKLADLQRAIVEFDLENDDDVK